MDAEHVILQQRDPRAGMSEVARGMNMSTRTLRRRLEQQGTSFRAVQQDVRMHLAGQYLTETTLTIMCHDRNPGESRGALWTRMDQSAIARLASTQRGVVSADPGLDVAAIKRRCRARRLHRIHRGVYLVGHICGAWRVAMRGPHPAIDVPTTMR